MKKEDNDDVPEVVNFFARRAKLTTKVSPEEFQATAKLLEESKGKKHIYPSNEELLCPPDKKKGRKKVPAKKASVKPIENILINDDAEEEEKIYLPPSAKKRLKKLQQQHERELMEVQAENEKLVLALDSHSKDSIIEEVGVEDDYEKINVLTISYLSEISRIKCYENDKFSTIFPKVAEKFNLKVSEFLLCLREQNIKVDDTPKSLAIVTADVLECIPYKPDSSTQQEHDEDRFKLFFQSSDSKGKIELFVHKLEKMQDVMERYSKARSIPLNQLAFEFDGEQIAGTESPEDLELESGNCIDVRVSPSEQQSSGSSSSNKSERRKNPRLQLVFTVESDSNDSDILICE